MGNHGGRGAVLFVSVPAQCVLSASERVLQASDPPGLARPASAGQFTLADRAEGTHQSLKLHCMVHSSLFFTYSLGSWQSITHVSEAEDIQFGIAIWPSTLPPNSPHHYKPLG